MATELVRYDAMCSAIAACHAIDEVQDIFEKARALEVYAMQARNFEAERKACDVRLRAERRLGELLAELHRTVPQQANVEGANQHGRSPATVAGELSPYREALLTNDIPERSAQRYQELAAVPAEVFEAALASPEKPSARRIVQEVQRGVAPMREDALWLWGRLRDFERDGFAGKDAHELFDAMTDAMRADVLRVAPAMADFLNELCEVDHEATA